MIHDDAQVVNVSNHQIPPIGVLVFECLLIIVTRQCGYVIGDVLWFGYGLGFATFLLYT